MTRSCPFAVGLAVMVALLAAARPSSAADPLVDEPVRLSVEFDPFPFFQHGFSVHAAVRLPGPLRFTIGAFGVTIPRQPASSNNEGWIAKETALEVSASYFFVDTKSVGLFGGLYLFGQRWSYSRDDVGGEAISYWITPAPALGLQCLPWGKGFYFVPWAGFGIPIRGGAPQLAGHVYDEPKLFPVFGIHLGFEVSVR